MSSGRILLTGVGVATFVGVLCIVVMALFGLEFNFVTIAVMALLVGATVSCFSNAGNFAWSGVAAAAISLVVLFVGSRILLSLERAEVLDHSHAEESYIRAIAETIMWQNAMQVDADEAGSLIPK